MTGVAKNTVLKLLVDLGEACAEYQDGTCGNLPCKRIQCDEIWSFCYAKQKNVPDEKQGTLGYGDVWTWTAIDADTKLVPSWLGRRARHRDCATEFMQDLALPAAPGRVQLTTDGLGRTSRRSRTLSAATSTTRCSSRSTAAGRRRRAPLQPGECMGSREATLSPATRTRSTSRLSYVERQNLTMRMGMRRFTRLTNGFSKKIENLTARRRAPLHALQLLPPAHDLDGRTPAMAAGVETRSWTVEDIISCSQNTNRKAPSN